MQFNKAELPFSVLYQVKLYLEYICAGERTLVGAAKLNQISLIVSFMLQESGGGGIKGISFFKSSDSTPSSFKNKKS